MRAPAPARDRRFGRDGRDAVPTLRDRAALHLGEYARKVTLVVRKGSVAVRLVHDLFAIEQQAEPPK